MSLRYQIIISYYNVSLIVDKNVFILFEDNCYDILNVLDNRD